MDKREKQKEVFIQLVNKQLEPFNVTYDDVIKDPDWYMRYRITPEQEEAFIEWGTDLIRKKLRMTKKMAKQEMSWFILQWGLTTNKVDRVEQISSKDVINVDLKKTKDNLYDGA